jgi:multidrug transporter EmrE-like cation transporter
MGLHRHRRGNRRYCPDDDKVGSERVGQFGETPVVEYVFRPFTNPFVILAIVAIGFGVLFYMFMISWLDPSFPYPVMVALGLIFAAVVSSLIFRENISLVRLGGIVVVIVGVFMLARS